MPKKKTHKEFVKQMNLVNPNVEILGTYINSATKILCRCKKDGNEWYTRPHDLLNGVGCPICGVIKRSNSKRKKHQDFLFEIKKIHPNIKILSKYIGAKSKILCECKICKYAWESTPDILLSGSGCPKCGGTLKKTHDEFVEEMCIKNKDIIIIGKYINFKTKILCMCKICNNTWCATPSNLLQGEGCPCCNKSKGEQKIKSFLQKTNIDYIAQYKYDDLIGVGNRKLSYDFYIPNYNLLIEFQGQQHYKTTMFNNILMEDAQQNFIKQQEHDNRKREYAKTHNINLLEIPYWEFDNIEEILESRLLKQSA